MTAFSVNGTIDQFIAELNAKGIQRCWWVFDHETGKVICSHSELAAITEHITSGMPDYDHHEGIFLQVGPETGTLQGVFVHHTNRGQAAGGTRFWFYDSVADFLFDGVRLSKGMAYKNALAGLWWGGGKAVIAVPTDRDHNDPEFRCRLFSEYAEFVSDLNGCYITAEDVGTRPEDMDVISIGTRYTTCIPAEKGGSGNPSRLTAIGTARGMEGALAALGMGSMAGKSVAIQGSGHVAQFLVEELIRLEAGRIDVYDIFEAPVEKTRSMFGDQENVHFHLIEKGDMAPLLADVDIVSPNATGGILNDVTIPEIKAPIVCGAANNQLKEEARHARMLHDAGITYVPDFLANRMGIVNCANEQYGRMTDDPAIERHIGYEWENAVYVRTKQIVEQSRSVGRTTYEMALDQARSMMEQPHPIWGNRSREIVRAITIKRS